MISPAAQLQQYTALKQTIEVAKDLQQGRDLVRGLAIDAQPYQPSARQLRALGPDMRIEVEEPADVRRARLQRLAQQSDRLARIGVRSKE